MSTHVRSSIYCITKHGPNTHKETLTGKHREQLQWGMSLSRPLDTSERVQVQSSQKRHFCIFFLYFSARICLDWLQSLKQFFINVSYHILVASLTMMPLN